MHIQLDALGGIAGDMFIAAVLDAWPEYTDGMLRAIRAAGLPTTCELSIIAHCDGVVSGRRFRVQEMPGNPWEHAGDSGQPDHAGTGHTSFAAIADCLHAAPLDRDVRDRALAIFESLAEAEAAVHGVNPEDVVFHELGAWDSVADIVGAAHLLHMLRPSSWSLGPIPIGGGRIQTAHGPMPALAPATTRLLQGFTLVDDGIAGERVTPTGAAILRHLHTVLGPPGVASMRPMVLERTGTGFGTQTLQGTSNILRVITFDVPPATRIDDQIGVIQFEVDDQTAEDLAIAVDTLRAGEGVLEVLQLPAIGKKGRLVSQIQLLCRREVLARVIDACFNETTTLGLRWSLTARATLERTQISVDAAGRQVGVKIVTRPSGRRSAKAEIEHSLGEGGHVGRLERRSAAEERALILPDLEHK